MRNVSGADVALVTHSALPLGAADDMLLAAALIRLGLSVRMAVWSDPAVRWRDSPLTVVRSVWDYHRSPISWGAWLQAVRGETKLLNSPELLRWNTDKRYLSDLAGRGVACVPTEFAEAGSQRPLRDIVGDRGWADVVVKPAIGASAAGARRFAGAFIGDAGELHLRSLTASGTALVQPYLRAVENARERSLVFIGGQCSHAFTKPAFSANAVGSTPIVLHEASQCERLFAKAALAAAPAVATYARVDVVPGDDGPVLMELELIEPDLALRLQPSAAPLLAGALEIALRDTHP